MPDRDYDALLALLEQRGPRPHAFGSDANDCLSFLAAAVKAQTGKSPLGRIRWRGDEKAALRALARHGGVEAILDSRFRRIAPAEAHRGDIGAIADGRLGMHPMLVEGPTLCTPGIRGLKRCPRAAMIAAWCVTEKPAPAKPRRAKKKGTR